MILLAAVYFIMPFVIGGKQPFDYSKYQNSVDSFMANAAVDTSWQEDNYIITKRNDYFGSRKYDRNDDEFVMKPFDPNGLPKEIWMQMGLSEKQAQVIKNFESKGGKFKTKEDVKKQFVVSDEFYKKIEEYLVFAEINDEVNSEHAALSIDINHATKEDFMLLNGVKDYLAEGIIKYRESLGGFYTTTQLKEVKYLSERIFNSIENHCFVTTYSLRKININLADYKELHQHPYINDELPAKIVDYRKKNGLFKNPDDFKRSGLVDDALYAKLVPYLSFIH